MVFRMMLRMRAMATMARMIGIQVFGIMMRTGIAPMAYASRMMLGRCRDEAALAVMGVLI